MVAPWRMEDGAGGHRVVGELFSHRAAYLTNPAVERIFAEPGDHAGDLETSLIMHLRPDLVVMEQAGAGMTVPWKLTTLKQANAWTPRPWSHVHPDTGSGDPSAATAAKGLEYFTAITEAVADLLVELSAARKGDLPYV